MKKHRVKNVLRELARHIGLKIVFVSYFPAAVHGRLLVRERRILLNAHQPRIEHIYTILHELGHYQLHILNPNRKHHPRWLDFNWRMGWLEVLCQRSRRYLRFIFRREAGREWEADLWAMCAFLYLARHQQVRCQSELTAFLERHPEKWQMFALAVTGMAWCRIKSNTQKISRFIAFGHSP